MGPKNKDPLLATIEHDIAQRYQCHTIILYGSHARNEATITSDFDIVAIREKGDFERDCQLTDKGLYLDVFIYSEDDLINPDKNLIRIKDGIVLRQKDHYGDELLSKIHTIFQAGPPITPAWEKQEIDAWMGKMLNRATINDIEGHFRRHWLLHDLLECYFKLRDAWYLGPKESFRWLKHHDALTYATFEKALNPQANLNSLENLIARVKL